MTGVALADYISSTTVSRRIINSTDSAIYEELTITLKDSITIETEDNAAITPDQLFAFLYALDLQQDVFGIQRLNHEKDKYCYEITLKTGVIVTDFKNKLFLQPPKIDGHLLKLRETRKMKDRNTKQITKVLIFEAPFQLPDEYIYNVLSQFGELYSDNISHHMYAGTDIYNGVRSMTFKEIKQPIPTVLYIRGNRVKTRYNGQDRSPICAICKTKGHFRTDCPDLQTVKEMLDKDRTENDPEPPEIKSWKQARQYVKDMKFKKAEEERKEKENKKAERKEEERKRLLAEKEQHVRDMLTRKGRLRGLMGPQPQTDTSSGEEVTDDAPYKSDGGFEEVKRRAMKQKRKKRTSSTQSKAARIQPYIVPRSPKVVPETNIEPLTSSPKSDTVTPQSSPYHPDIGESNGTVLGDGSFQERDTTDEEFQDVKSQESQSQDEEKQKTDQDPKETQPIISDTYPQPGQPNQQAMTIEPATQETSYASLLQTSDKPWADQMEEEDARRNGDQ